MSYRCVTGQICLATGEVSDKECFGNFKRDQTDYSGFPCQTNFISKNSGIEPEINKLPIMPNNVNFKNNCSKQLNENFNFEIDWEICDECKKYGNYDFQNIKRRHNFDESESKRQKTEHFCEIDNIEPKFFTKVFYLTMWICLFISKRLVKTFHVCVCKNMSYQVRISY